MQSMPIATEITRAVQPTDRKGLEHLRWCLDDHVLVILNLDSGQYHALGEDVSWRFIAYVKGATDPQLEASLVQAGLLGAKCPKARPWKPLVVPGEQAMAVKTLLAARRRLASSKFRSTLDWASAHHSRKPLCGAITAFRRAEAFFPSRLGDRDCLPRALGLFAFLRHAAYSPNFVIGFKRYPFTAHAWVEVDGTPVLESQTGRNQIASFREILRVC